MPGKGSLLQILRIECFQLVKGDSAVFAAVVKVGVGSALYHKELFVVLERIVPYHVFIGILCRNGEPCIQRGCFRKRRAGMYADL